MRSTEGAAPQVRPRASTLAAQARRGIACSTPFVKLQDAHTPDSPASETATAIAVVAAQPRARDIGVKLVGVVGSVARGEAGPDSDVDVVFDATREGFLWSLCGLAMDLQDVLGRRIDLVDRAMMKADRWTWMSRDLVML